MTTGTQIDAQIFEAMARAICIECGDKPDSPGDAPRQPISQAGLSWSSEGGAPGRPGRPAARSCSPGPNSPDLPYLPANGG